uniref:FAS1-like dehydratase domain-containing protein n=1 Tax=Nocardioides terrisoli TaxID=3388267 RepID=UPI0037CC73B9
MRTTIDTLTSQRYARAIGDNNPIFFDEAAAKAAGYDGIVVPPNFLPSYLDWTDGGSEDELRIDGTKGDDMQWIPLEGVRLMGGGEEMIFHAPVYVDTEVVMTSHLDDVTARESRSGLLMVIKVRNNYKTAGGTPLMTSVRTVLGR